MEEEDFRTRIANMPLGDVLKLKSEIGSTSFNEIVLGKKKQPLRRMKEESDDEAPMEMSSKRRVPFLGTEKKKHRHDGPRVRDPRFDSRCGDFKAIKFRENYEFVFDMKLEELSTLKRQLRETQDEHEKEKIRFVMQRIKNQIRDHKLQMEANKKRQEEREQAGTEGRPVYMKKKDKRMAELVDKYETLKNSGGLKKHIEKRRKKFAGKMKKKMDL